MKKYVLIVLDGAADLARIGGRSLLQLAHIPNIDYITSLGVAGLMDTLYDDLPKGSIVAQLGMLGYDPHLYYPNGRASCEALAINVTLDDGDLAFRANLAYIENSTLASYNAGYIKSKCAEPLIQLLQKELASKFPKFELYHNSDFRNTLIIRNANIPPSDLICPQPHENVGERFDSSQLVKGRSKKSNDIANRVNSYITATIEILQHEQANVIFPWSPSSAIRLPRFSLLDEGKCGVITHMDFLHGIAKASGIDCFKMGNGNWDTDYVLKGKGLIELLSHNYRFVFCHINGPDEASHMGSIEKKVYSIEQIDEHIVTRAIKYFTKHSQELGGVIVTTDHYTNVFANKRDTPKIESHSKNPVPFVLWNNAVKDSTTHFSEEDVLRGKYAKPPINHLDLLKLLSMKE